MAYFEAKMREIRFRRSAPDPAGGAYSILQTPSWSPGHTSKGKGGEERGYKRMKGREERKREGKKRKGMGRKGREE